MVGSRLGDREVPAMAIDVGIPRSRRAVLAAALGGLAASAAHALGRPTAALATDGQPILQSVDNGGTGSTVVRSSGSTALQGVTDAATGANYGVRGRSSSTSGIGTFGIAAAASGSTIGVYGTSISPSGTGVKGEAPIRGVEGIATATTGGAVGVRAVTHSATGYGVAAENAATADDATAIAAQAQGVAISALATGVVGKGLVAVANSAIGATIGVDGRVAAPAGVGVRGWSTDAGASARGVFGTTTNGTGVHGWVGPTDTSVPPTGKSGVFGQCDIDASSHGAYGRSAAGFGVRGRTSSGYGVFAEATGATGTALKVSGKAVFTRSGKATVPNGSSSVVVSSVTLTSSSLILATIQGSAASGLYVRYVAPSIGNSNFTIKLSKAVTADTKVGWFIVN